MKIIKINLVQDSPANLKDIKLAEEVY